MKNYLISLYKRSKEKIRSLLKAGLPLLKEYAAFAFLSLGKMKGAAIFTGLALAMLFVILFLIPPVQELMIRVESSSGQPSEDEMKTITAETRILEKSIKKLERDLAAKVPGSPFLVINTSENKIRLYKNRKLVRTGDCSTGSYILLESENEQKWMFKTPRGKFRIQGKISSPVWRKPDWAFVEEGLDIPPASHPSRYEYGVLGDYALSLGHGYLIHGTLYKRLLGMPVTHGCVRLNDEDLEAVYYTLEVGSRVYIY